MNDRPVSAGSKLACPWLYFGVTIGWTWLFWLPAAFMSMSVRTPAGAVLALLGLLGPMATGIGFTYLTRDSEGRRDYWMRIIDLRRIPPRWYLLIFLFVPSLMAVTIAFDLVSGGNLLPIKKAIAPFVSSPLSLFPMALAVFFVGPFPEELGWRGYVLDRLQEKRGALRSSLILGFFWALWHLPLFFIRDTYQYDKGAWTPWFWLFMIGIIPLSVVFTWIFNNTSRSTLAVIFFHFMVVFTDEFLNQTLATDLYSTLLWIIAASLIICIRGSKTLTRSETPPEVART